MTLADFLLFPAGFLLGLWLARPSVGARRIAGMRLARGVSPRCPPPLSAGRPVPSDE